MSDSGKNNSVIFLSKDDVSFFTNDVTTTIYKSDALLECHFTRAKRFSDNSVKHLCELLVNAHALREYLEILFPDMSKGEYEVPAADLLKLTKVAAIMQEIRNDLRHASIILDLQ